MNHHKQGVCSKNAPCLTRPARARQDVPFLKQGRRGFGARIVHGVREGERREERQACEREADKRPSPPLADLFNIPTIGGRDRPRKKGDAVNRVE